MFVAKVEMLIRRPAREVFEAFVDPAITSKFWFTRGSGRLEAGRAVRWDWENYGFSVNVTVEDIEPERRIVLDWAPPGEAPTNVEWSLRGRPDGTTYVTISSSGFAGD